MSQNHSRSEKKTIPRRVSPWSVISVIKSVGITAGIVLDLGCGMGAMTPRWQRETQMTTVGLDRQYHPEFYDQVWKSGQENLHFLRADFAQGIPFSDECAAVIIMQSVVGHVDEASIVYALVEISRVLEPGGLLFVSPQDTQDYSYWRIFRKESDGNGGYSLEEVAAE